jgi:endonuclease/exonuclease/phosphatase family metal-dependent hydrolase
MGACLLTGSLFFAREAPAQQPKEKPPTPPEVRFVSWNLRNYLHTVRAPENPAPRDTKPKPQEEIAAITRILTQMKPDILGVSEVGGRDDLEALQSRLREAGFDLPHLEYVAAADKERHLGMLSRFPLASRQSQTRLSYLLDDSRLPVQRGFLDVTLQVTPEYQLRCIGVHLKSHLDTPEANQALMRRHEAHLLRQYADTILTAAPETNLLLYGDLNDTRDQPAVRAIPGFRGSDNYLTAVIPTAPDGDRWTHYYEEADTYSRIDYFYASRALMPEVQQPLCTIYHGADWSTASDHRAIAFVFKAADRPARRRPAAKR